MTLKGVAVGYGRQPVLSGIDLSVRRGTFTGLLGANGSGKSTLLKTILGIIPPLGGSISFSPVNGRVPVLGYVPQREALDSIYILSSFDVALMGVAARVRPGMPIPASEREWVRHCLQEVGAADLEKKRFAHLSGGQKQRVLIARALAVKPDFLLLDEPASGIDPAATQAAMDLLGRLHREQKLSILLVSHDLASVRKTVEEIVWLHQGRVIQGPADQMLRREMIEAILELEFR
jgi:ABC-type Mn2+/Zn2+ transport system ATPase subunit